MKVENLIADEGTEKWCAKFEPRNHPIDNLVPINITINIKKEYPPIILTHYSLNWPTCRLYSQPSAWELFGVSESGQTTKLHEKNDYQSGVFEVSPTSKKLPPTREFKINHRVPFRKFVLRILKNKYDPKHVEDKLFCELGKIRLYAAPAFDMVIKYEKLNHRINYADGMALIERKGGRPVTRF